MSGVPNGTQCGLQTPVSHFGAWHSFVGPHIASLMQLAQLPLPSQTPPLMHSAPPRRCCDRGRRSACRDRWCNRCCRTGDRACWAPSFARLPIADDVLQSKGTCGTPVGFTPEVTLSRRTRCSRTRSAARLVGAAVTLATHSTHLPMRRRTLLIPLLSAMHENLRGLIRGDLHPARAAERGAHGRRRRDVGVVRRSASPCRGRTSSRCSRRAAL